MSKAVLISIQPKWCELIASGKKTVEVRKRRPNLAPPFKVYIYCTKDEPLYHSGVKFCCNNGEFGNGKVIGEFVCDRIDEYTNYSLDEQHGHIKRREDLLRSACMTLKDWRDYIGSYRSDWGCAWHISNLIIYDEPKELNKFKKINRECWYADLGLAKRDCPECKNKDCFVTRPPQSWCYVEELKGGAADE